MQPATSLYLDAVRFLAATAVFLSHASYAKWTGGFLWQLQPLGPRAVDIFFVLSGFVIAYVTDGREADAKTYASSRAARIYSVAIPALILTAVLNVIGQSIDPAPYVSANRPGHSLSIESFLASVTFTSEIWNLHLVFGTNEPYWSLGFEIWYYVIFGLFVFLPGRWGWVGAIAALAVAGPKVAILFPLWLLGVGCYFFTKKIVLPNWLGGMLFAGSIIGFGVYMRFLVHDDAVAPFYPLSFGYGRLSSYIDNYAAGFLFCMNLIGFNACAGIAAPFISLFSKQIRWLAGATFSMYLFHQPILEFLVAILPFPPSSVAVRAAVFIGTPIIVFALAEVTERQKKRWRDAIAWLSEKVAFRAA